MKRIRYMWKAVMACSAAAMIALALTGCKKTVEQPVKTEHPSGEHPK